MSNRDMVPVAESENRVPTPRWYYDGDGQFWNFSKSDGGLRVENEDGTFGRPIPSWVAKDDFGVKPCDAETSAVLDEFEKLKKIAQTGYGADMDTFRALRANVMRIVRLAKEALETGNESDKG